MLKEIFRDVELLPDSTILRREAVRGVILRGRSLLMIYSGVNKDYKFPGGGVAPGESHQQALARELLEEGGANLTGILGEVGFIREYFKPFDPGFDIFEMTSYYYRCAVDDGEDFSPRRLDKYERDLRFQPVWVDIDAAIQRNTELLQNPGNAVPRWTERDTFVMRYVRNLEQTSA